MTAPTETPSAPTRSCANCPSFMGQLQLEDQISTYGTLLKAPSCPIKGKLLGGPHATNEVNGKVQEKVAAGCDSFGKQPPRSAARHSALTIALGMPVVKDREQNEPQPKSCRSCTYYVPAKKMQEQIGTGTGGMCTQFGKIISEQNTTKQAKSCSNGRMLDPSQYPNGDLDMHYDAMLSDVAILPELRPAYKRGGVIGQNIPEPEAPFVEPGDHPTDAPVTDEDKSHGIKAWRRVANEDDTKSVMLPVFDVNFFDEAERSKIPVSGDDNHPEQYRDHGGLEFRVAAIWKMGETPALHGIAGTGKTEFFRYIAWKMQLPFERVSITASSELDDLQGKTHFENDETVFKMGRVPKAWAKPCVQVIDEPNVGSPSVWQFLRPMTDSAKQLVMDVDEGQVIDRHPYSYLGFAMNPAWDHRNVGAEVLSDADGSRLMHVFVDYPGEKLEKEIIRKRCALDGFKISPDEINKVMAIAKSLRDMSDNNTLSITWGIRNQIKVARALQFFSWHDAYRLAAGDNLEPAQRDLILDQVSTHTSFGR